MEINPFKQKQTDSVTLDWKGKYELFMIEANEDFDSFVKKLNASIPNLNLSTLDKRGFYMLILGTPNPDDKKKYKRKELSYIGQTYKQTLRERIPQEKGHEKAFECIIKRGKGYYLYLAVGGITQKSVANETEDLYNDIENCLIFTNQPVCNTDYKKAYLSKRCLSILNTGSYQPLRESSACG